MVNLKPYEREVIMKLLLALLNDEPLPDSVIALDTSVEAHQLMDYILAYLQHHCAAQMVITALENDPQFTVSKSTHVHSKL